MNASDIFYIVATVVLLFVAAISWYAVSEFVLTLRILRRVLEDVKDTTEDFSAVKNGLKLGVLNLLNRLIGDSERKEVKG